MAYEHEFEAKEGSFAKRAEAVDDNTGDVTLAAQGPVCVKCGCLEDDHEGKK